MTEQKLVAVCQECGSYDVYADAYAEWDVEAQEWTIQNVFDKGSYCEDCDGECTIEFIPFVEEAVSEPQTEING